MGSLRSASYQRTAGCPSVRRAKCARGSRDETDRSGFGCVRWFRRRPEPVRAVQSHRPHAGSARWRANLRMPHAPRCWVRAVRKRPVVRCRHTLSLHRMQERIRGPALPGPAQVLLGVREGAGRCHILRARQRSGSIQKSACSHAAVFAVFDANAEGAKGITNGIGCSPILIGFGVAPQFDQEVE